MAATIVIGGGFYGCAIALHLRRRGFADIHLIEREPELLRRASYTNQARVHNGCHYPRSFVTAYRSRINLPRFVRDYGFAVKRDFSMLYAIARKRSKVTAHQFERFMQQVGIAYERASSEYVRLFNPRTIADVFATEEFAFDTTRLREYFMRELASAGVQVHLNTETVLIKPQGSNIDVELRSATSHWTLSVEQAFNCTYTALNHNVRNCRNLTPLKHELTEMALVDVPPQLAKLGVTVMDGPFFSCMPFPAEACHSLSHVRYTPHGSMSDEDGQTDPAVALSNVGVQSKFHFMVAAAKQYMPCIQLVRHRRSLFEIKTVLVRNEADDGRPILFRRELEHPRLFSVLGGKIDNIYDILAKLDAYLLGHHEPANETASTTRT